LNGPVAGSSRGFLSLQATLRVLRKLPGFMVAERRPRSWLQKRTLQRLNDVLAETPLAGHYWLFGGLLLGWAREGRLLLHDFRDADFAYEAADDDRFAAAVPAIIEAGFEPLFRYRNSDSEYTEHSFKRAGSQFEFFRMTRDGANWRYHMYDEARLVEMIGQLAAQPLEEIEFLGRTWLKPVDHEAELVALYGDWRTPKPDWYSLDDDLGIVARRAWKYPDYRWSTPPADS
jgi:hypothetical protein